MTKLLFSFIFCFFLFSCSKKSFHPEPGQATGYLHFSSPAYDGTGLTFLTDSGLNMHQEYLYFYDDTGDLFLDYDQFKDSIGLHLRMNYLDEGRRGCPFCQTTPTSLDRIVKLNSLVKE